MFYEKNKICLGVFAGAFGIHGEVKVKCFTQSRINICNYNTLYTKDTKVFYELIYIRVNKSGVICRVKGINNRELVKKLNGIYLYIMRDLLPKTKKEDFYYIDLVGLNVRDKKNFSVGTVLSIHNFGAGDLLKISSELIYNKQCNLNFFIPFTIENIPEINIKEGYIVLSKNYLNFKNNC